MAMRRFSLHKIMRRAVSDQSQCRAATATRSYVTAAASKDSTGSGGYYESPFQEIFDTIKAGKTFLGSTEFSSPVIKYLKCGCPEHVLKYKTKSYGRLLEEPFVMPMEHRVTLQVEIRQIPLSEMEQLALKEIVGNRLNTETGLLQLSSSQFGSRIENKRHAVSMLERIVESAKKLSSKVEAEAGLAQEAT